jgi:hypothetical protein
MKTKLVRANYDAEMGISEAVVKNKNGHFTGHALCHPKEEHPSNFAGCRIAEARAIINSVRYEKNVLNSKIKALQDFEKILKNLKDYNPDSVEGRRLRKRIHELKAERKAKREHIAAMKAALNKTIAERDEYFAKQKK